MDLDMIHNCLTLTLKIYTITIRFCQKSLINIDQEGIYDIVTYLRLNLLAEGAALPKAVEHLRAAWRW